ncbi:MAG: family 16 glycosylhydrolase [Christensenellales bacterium]
MKKLALVVVLIILAISALSLTGCQKIDMEKFDLVWQDDFLGDKLDDSKWHYDYAQPSDGSNGVLRKGGYWVNDAVEVRDGNLIITTDWREDGAFGAGWYSGAVSTEATDYYQGSFTQRYGYFEIRCKVPAIYGSWSAFWLMPVDNFSLDYQSSDYHDTAVDGAEIDIFESPFYYDLSARYTVSHAVHYDGYREHLKSAPKTGVNVPNLYGEFHTYGLEWTEKYYKFYVDGVCTWTVTDEKYKNRQGQTIYQNIVSQVEEYIILSNEVVSPDEEGGTKGWCGDLSQNDKSKKYEFVIDYVKVYQHKQ